ncbi:MAG: phage baseplate assembly protein V [Acidobacteriota bacterium]
MNLTVDQAPRETAHEAGGYVKGVAVAIVTQNQDDQGLGRVKVRFPWHEKTAESYWARLATPMAGKDRGLVTIPEVGDEVLVAFEREDLRFPFVLGALWNGKDKPPFDNNDGKNDKRLFKSRKGHTLLFDDGSKGIVELRHERGRMVTFDDDGFVVQDEKGNTVKVDSGSGAMTIEAKGELTIKAMKITLQANSSIDIKASATATIQAGLVRIN